MAISLLTPLLEGGIPNTNFFQGRVLAAEDLRTEQEANRQHHRQLGLAIGVGVVHGLAVRIDANGAAPVLAIGAGLAINRRGHTLELPVEQKLALTREGGVVPAEAGVFAPCSRASTTSVLSSGGTYVLLMSPASGFRERAPMIALDSDGRAAGCGSRYAVEGVQFRLEAVPLDGVTEIAAERQALTALSPTAAARAAALVISRFRNVLGHLCLAQASAAGQAAEMRPNELPAFAATSSLLDALRSAQALTDCDVPLAVFYWDAVGIRFLDTWAVRRLARWYPRPDSLSLFPAHGLERLLQFLAHLDDLLAPPLLPDQHRIEEFFRYVPPAAYFPVSGAGSPGGLRPSRFLAAFTAGSPGQLGAGFASALFERSFPFAAVDLTQSPYLQVYQIAENAAAVTAEDSSQRYHVYVSRALNGPAGDDGVTEAFEDAWEVYRGLIRRRVFLPLAATAEAVAAQITIVEAVRDVMQVANRQAARAAAFALDDAGAIAAFGLLYDVQKDLTTLFLSNIPGITDSQGREIFASAIDGFLNQTLPGGAPGLKPSLDAAQLRQAVTAQNAINQFVGTWSGEGVAIGPTTLPFLASSQGGNIVPGGQATPYQFQLNNGTDRRLAFKLEAIVDAPSGTWQGAATIHSTTGVEIDSLDLPSGGQATIEVRVVAPADAQVGETATLTLIARVGPPTNRAVTATLPLPIAADQGAPVTRTVSFVGDALTPPGGMNVSAAPNTILTYGFDVRYGALQSPNTAPFDFTVTLAPPTPGQLVQWQVGIGQPEPAPAPSPGVFRQRIQLNSRRSTQVAVFVMTPRSATASPSASFTVRIDFVDLSPAIGAQRPETFTIQVT